MEAELGSLPDLGSMSGEALLVARDELLRSGDEMKADLSKWDYFEFYRGTVELEAIRAELAFRREVAGG